MKGTYVQHIYGSISTSPVLKPIHTLTELQESQPASVITVSKQ